MSYQALVDAYEGLGQRLFASLVEGPGNIVLSPLSIGTAMAMVLAGARGETEAEIVRVLRYRMDREEIAAASAALIRTLESYGRQDAVHIAVANALLLDEALGKEILPTYRELVGGCFAAEIMAGATPEDVNGWVAGKTFGLVPRLLEHVDALAAALIVNAMAFAASWATPFDPALTRPAPFSLIDGSSVPVPMMELHLYAQTVAGIGYRAIQLPFSPPHLGLVCVVPERIDELDAIEAGRDVKSRVGSARKPTYVAVSLPKFRITSSIDLTLLLREIGLDLAFTDDADFGGMADPDPGVKIGQIRHGACIEVHEAGCTAATATVVEIVAAGAARIEPEPFVVDRPFLYLLVDTLTGATLVQGRVVDPRG